MFTNESYLKIIINISLNVNKYCKLNNKQN